MRIIQITPGAGKMFCGGCFRDNALVAELRRQGHDALMVPLYLPLTLDEADQTQGTPIFYGGINVYLDNLSPLYRKAPKWFHSIFDSPALLNLASGAAARTRPEATGNLALSMLRGEDGPQARELDELITWLKQTGQPNVICLSNAMLIGMARRLKSALNAPVVCTLQGEDWFLDALPTEYRKATWDMLRERCRDVDMFVAPSRYYADVMRGRLGVPAEKMRVVFNGISLEGYAPAVIPPAPPVLGYFSRLCEIKGLEMVVDAFIILKSRNHVKNLHLRAGGGMGPNDEKFVRGLRERLQHTGCAGDAEFHPNLDRAQKVEFLRTMTVSSAPAMYGEAFGLYVIESLAAGVPVVQPRHAAFPELIEATGGGLLCEPNAKSLADALEPLLLDPVRCRALGEAGRKAGPERFNVSSMAAGMLDVFRGMGKSSLGG